MAGEILVVLGILLLVLLVMTFVIGMFALWIWMIIDCAQRKFKGDNEKVVWILVIVLLSYLGAIIYYFTVKRSDKK